MTLKKYMLVYSVTSREMAIRLSVSMSAVRKWMQGNRIPRHDTMRKIRNFTKGRVSYDDWR